MIGWVDDDYDELFWVISVLSGWNLICWSVMNGGVIVVENY